MERLPDWEERLNAFVAEFSDPAHPGHHAPEPCGHFAMGGIKALTGEKVGYAYRSATDAKRLIAKHGKSLEGVVDSKLEPHPAPAFARRGDIVMTDEGNLAIAFGKFALVLTDNTPTGEPGLQRVPMHLWKKAWKIG
jgi:hypothetical protein